MFGLILFLLFFFYFFLEIKISSYSAASFLPFLIFSLLCLKKDFRSFILNNKKLTIIWLIFIFINIISAVFSPFKYLALKGLMKIVSFFLLFWIIFWFLRANNWNTFLRFLIIILIFSVILNLFLFFYPNLIFTYLSGLYLHPITYPRLGYPFSHPNFFGSFLIIMLIIILFHQPILPHRLTLYILISLGIILTGSKASFIFYLLFSIINLFLKESLSFKISLLTIMIIASLIFGNLWLQSKENKILGTITQQISGKEDMAFVEKLYTIESYKTSTVQGRIEIWRNALFYILQRPLIGYGPLVQRYELTKVFVHNLFFDFLLNYGILGFLFLLFVIKELTKKIISVKKPIYTFFFLYFLLNIFIESMFFNGIIEIIFFAFIIKLINEKVFNHHNNI